LEKLHLRFDERQQERARLARNLHDTLIQTVMATKIFADDARRLESDPARRSTIDRISAGLAQAVDESRAALESMRASTFETVDLAEAFELAALEARPSDRFEIEVNTVGTARPLHPIVRDEIYRIGGEAIRNACLHSNGGRLRVELVYGRDLTLKIEDNGVGVDPELLRVGKPSHFGLAGMRERARHIGAKLIFSTSACGTEVTLLVPHRAAFSGAPAFRDFIERLFVGIVEMRLHGKTSRNF
jgi:signal transduction histidine kinase